MGDQNFTVHRIDGSQQVIFGNGNVVHTEPGSGRQWPGELSSDPVFGIVTALPEEFAAVRALLYDAGRPWTVTGDRALYVLGAMPSRDETRPHRIVLTLLGETGNSAAAESCANLIRSFPSVDTVLMCGIACGVPAPQRPDRHVRLGDIVAATWGIDDYDHVTETDGGRQPRQTFPSPSAQFVRLATYLAAVEISGERPWEKWIAEALAGLPAFARPDDATDRFSGHPPRAATGHRAGLPKVHHGLIGSADRSLRSARIRDSLAAARQPIAFEMEGKGIGSAGFAAGLDWFVIRGISDYGDAHTNRKWRGYASVVAAGYVRAILAECPPLSPRGGHTQATR